MEFTVVAHRQLDVAGDDPHLSIAFGGVVGQSQDLSHDMLEHGHQINGSSLANVKL